MYSVRAFYLLIQLIVITSIAYGSEPARKISDEVFFYITHDPIVGAYVMLDGTSLGAITDACGSFNITDIPVSGYRINVASAGFHPRIMTDIIVKSERQTVVEIALETAVISGAVIEVRPEYFKEDET